MASFSCNTKPLHAPLFLTGLAEKKALVLDHLAASSRWIDVRPASRLEIRAKPEMASSGIAQVDTLTGGLPRGCLSEICGSASSGKTSLLLAAMASATQREESCVLIDASDSFDPESGAAAEIDFAKLLWVRCGKKLSAVNSQSSEKTSAVARRCSLAKQSAANFENDDQRLSANDYFSHDSRRTAHDVINTQRLEQVLKTTDLVLQSGGFGMVVLDLAGIPEKYVRRIPLASWFRFQRAVEHTKTILLVVSEVPCAQTCASLVLELRAKPSGISYQASAHPSHAQLLESMQIDVELARTRLERKPMQSVKSTFATRAVRAG